MRLQSPPTPQTYRPITYNLGLHTRDKSLRPRIDDQPLLYLRTNPQPTASPRHAKSLFNPSPPAHGKRSCGNQRRKPGNNSSYRSKRNPPKSTLTPRFPLLHPPMTPFYFVGPPGAAERGHCQSNREERPLFIFLNLGKKPHLRLTNPQRSPLLAHGAKLM